MSNSILNIRNGAMAVIALALLVYANSLGGGFVWADHTVIGEGRAILGSPADWARAFTQPLWDFTGSDSPGGYFRPIAAASYTIDHAIWGENPFGYHLTNVLLHAFISLFVFLTLARALPSLSVALIAALLFAAHPVHTEAVAWISGRTGLLAALGISASLFFFLESERRPGFFGISLLFFAFGLGAKESAVLTPILLFLVVRAKNGRISLVPYRRLVPYAVLTVVYIFYRQWALGGIGTGSAVAIPPATLVPTMLRVLGGYLRLLLLPIGLHTNDAVYLSQSVFDPRAFFSLAAIAGFVWSALKYGGERRTVLLGLLWTATALLPFLNLVPLLHFRAERLLYLPSIGFVIVLAAALERWIPHLPAGSAKFGRVPSSVLAGGALALVLGGMTIARNPVWKDDRTLFEDTIRKSPYAPEARYMLGYDAYEKGNYSEAAQHFTESLRIDPNAIAFLPTPWALANLGYSFQKLGDSASAVRAFQRAIQIFPGMERAEFGLALALQNLGESDQAIAIYRSVLTRIPRHEDAHYNLGIVYESMDSLARAEESYRNVLDINPSRKEAHTNLGSVLAQMGRGEEALASYHAALHQDAMDPKVHFNVGLLYARNGQSAPAIEALTEALALDSTYSDARELLEFLQSQADER
ncbi:MAG: tetratricopeptide repeat protein [Gemmatimonadetes bacterium]|nr:tetratricopeptide repeat protein [Gemmatimonadota bacterium]